MIAAHKYKRYKKLKVEINKILKCKYRLSKQIKITKSKSCKKP